MDIDGIDKGIFRLRVPFETLTTSVYFYVCPQGAAIIDSATYPTDVDGYIIPALEALNVRQEDVKHLLLTHNHCDHAGGIVRLAEIFPNATVGTSFETDLPNAVALWDGQTVIGTLRAVHLPGHTGDTYGFYDTATKTLLSGDCLQLDGVGKYRDNIWKPALYIDSVNKLKGMEIKRIVAAHEFDPLGSIAEGEIAVAHYLEQCIAIAQKKIKAKQ